MCLERQMYVVHDEVALGRRICATQCECVEEVVLCLEDNLTPRE